MERKSESAEERDSGAENPPEDIPEVYWVQSLSQLKAVADPLRIRILENLIEEPRTTKQVARLIGEKTTKLYHHVDALEKAGLIELRSTRQNRGTLEKYYRAVAKLFRAEPDLLSTGESTEEWASLGAQMLSATAEELRTSVADLEPGRRPMLIQAKVEAEQERIDELQQRLEALLKDFSDEQAALEKERDGKAPERANYRLALAFYPVKS